MEMCSSKLQSKSLGEATDAVLALPKLAKIYLQKASVMHEMLKSKLSDNISVRTKTVRNAISDIVKTHPQGVFEQFDQIVEILKGWGGDFPEIVYVEAMNKMSEIVKRVPEKSSDASKILSSRFNHYHRDVRRAAARTVAEIVANISHKADETFEMYFSKFLDDENSAWQEAIYGISEIVKLLSHRSGEAFEILISRCNIDEPGVCEAVLNGLTEIVKILPQKAPRGF